MKHIDWNALEKEIEESLPKLQTDDEDAFFIDTDKHNYRLEVTRENDWNDDEWFFELFMDNEDDSLFICNPSYVVESDADLVAHEITNFVKDQIEGMEKK